MNLKKTLITLLFLIYPISTTTASDALSEGGKVIVYGDGTLKEVSKHIKKELKDVLKAKKIKIEEKGKKGSSLNELIERFEKDVLSKEPDFVLLTIPISSAYKHKEGTLDIDISLIFSEIKTLSKRLQEQDITVAIATPALAGENITSTDTINTTLDELADLIRTYCKEQDIPCCDFRNVAVHFLKNNKPKKKSKGQLTKNGTFITKSGAVILSGPLKGILGLSSNTIDSPLVASDRVVFFKGGGSQWAGINFNNMRDNITKRIEAKYNKLQPILIPKYVHFTLGDSMFQPADHSVRILKQKPRVAFIQLMHRMYPADKMEEKYDFIAKKYSDLSAKLATSPHAHNIFFLNEPLADLKADDPLRAVFTKINAHIQQCAKENGLRVFDLNQLITDAQRENPSLKLWNGPKSPYYSQEFLKLIENEICTIIGINN